MISSDTRLKEEYGNVVVNGRKVGEAVMIGADIAVFVARVIGQQVRIGVASRSGTKVLREETYRQAVAERLSEGPQTFQPLYRVKEKDRRPCYVLKEIAGKLCEYIGSTADFTAEDYPLLVARFATKAEAEAFCLCAVNVVPDCRAEAEEDHRKWFAIVQFYDKHLPGEVPRETYTFLDRSLPWEELSSQTNG